MVDLLKGQNKINISVDQVIVRNIEEIHNESDINFDKRIIGIRSFIRNDLEAAIFMIIPFEMLSALFAEMDPQTKIADNIETIEDLDESIKSAIIEFGNIIMSHYCSGISDFLKIQVIHNVPEIAIDLYGAVIDGDIAKLAQHTDKIIMIRNQFQIRNKTISGQILFIPSNDSVDNLIKWIDVDKIVALLEAEALGINTSSAPVRPITG